MEGLAKPSTAGGFLLATTLTTLALTLTYMAPSSVERWARRIGGSSAPLTSLIMALALGIHNVG